MTPQTHLLEKAIGLALMAHSGQRHANGEPYILHPLRLMHQLPSMAAKVTALLHEVVELGDLTLEDLAQAGVPEAICEALEALTQQLDESFEDYIERLAENPLARQVKLADLEDDLQVGRLVDLKRDDLLLVKQRHGALKRLQALGNL